MLHHCYRDVLSLNLHIMMRLGPPLRVQLLEMVCSLAALRLTIGNS